MASNNRTLHISHEEVPALQSQLLRPEDLSALAPSSSSEGNFLLSDNKVINSDTFSILPLLPDGFANLIIVDPPYNLRKDFGEKTFKSMKESKYEDYLRSWFYPLCDKLADDGTLYMCGDWKCCSSMQRVISERLTILNRITWQREKGRGSSRNWKNSMEDIWFAVKNPNNYFFNPDAVKQRRRVIAPYRQDGAPKDWEETPDGKYRDTGASNFWDDISVPFWSMLENTDHPTQKPEKLIAKLILASSRPGDMVFDPFLGSGTTVVTAKKLSRRSLGIELDPTFSLLAQKRLNLADSNPEIQGYKDGVFWERNSGK